jgi:hypothetical protein
MLLSKHQERFPERSVRLNAEWREESCFPDRFVAQLNPGAHLPCRGQ